MPLYLVRETEIPGPMSVVAADRVTEIEIEAQDALTAAAQVMFRKPGRLPAELVARTSRDPYLDIYVEPDRARYAGVIDIRAGKPETLPRIPGESRLPVDAVAREVLRLHALISGPEDAGDTTAVMRNLLGTMLDFARSEHVDFGKLLIGIAHDWETITGREQPDFHGLDFDSDAHEITHSGIRAGAAAVALHTFISDIEDHGDAEIGLFHLAFTLIENANQKGIDFTDLLGCVLNERALEAVNPSI